MQTLDKQAFASLRQIAKRILVPLSTIRYRLVSKMANKLKHCRWIPHRLWEAQKQTRVTTSKCLLDLLCSIQHHGWKYLIVLDEAWSYFPNQHEEILLMDHEAPPTIECQTISSPKTMLTVVWNPYGFHLVNVLSKGQKWTSHYYIDHIFPEIGALRDARGRREFVVHADNASPHVAKRVKQYLDENRLRSAPCLPYSPDLAPNDLFSSAI
jgi:hypothetical protein